MTQHLQHIHVPARRLRTLPRLGTGPRLDGGRMGLVLLGVVVFMVGAVLPAVMIAGLAGAATASRDVAAGVAADELPFLLAAAAATAVWLVGAIQTRRAIQRLGGLNEGDRAAIAELHRLLARE